MLTEKSTAVSFLVHFEPSIFLMAMFLFSFSSSSCMVYFLLLQMLNHLLLQFMLNMLWWLAIESTEKLDAIDAIENALTKLPMLKMQRNHLLKLILVK